MTRLSTKKDLSFKRLNFAFLFMCLFLFDPAPIKSQTRPDNALWLENSVQINGTVDEAWDVLADFAGVGDFHVLYDEAIILNRSSNEVALGVERESFMPDGMYNLIQKERVVDVLEGAYFTYEIYDSEKPTMESMLVTYGVSSDADGNVTIYNHVTFKEDARVWKKFSKRKHNRESQISLISFKHRIETGDAEKDLKRLKKWYALEGENQTNRDFLATTDIKVN